MAHSSIMNRQPLAFANPSFTDINGDGKSDMMIGEAYGGIRYFQRTDATTVERWETTPMGFKVYSNYPNPFNANTVIQYELPYPAGANIAIFNSSGQRVRLISDGYHQAGFYTVQWDGKDERGAPLSSGIYFCRIHTSKDVQAIKLLLLR